MLLILLLPVSATAEPTTVEQARRVVQYWLHQNQQPMETKMGTEVLDVETFSDDAGQPLYHVVSLQPDGFVIIAGDDHVEPIIAFVPEGKYDPSPDNPLGALVSGDVPARVERARGGEALDGNSIAPALQEEAEDSSRQKAQQKWNLLDRKLAEHDYLMEAAGEDEPKKASISDVRVSPLLKSKWNQSTEDGGNDCYNLYTPQKYVCGCVATAMSQIMYYFKYPTTAVGTTSFPISVDGVGEERNLRGGDGNGGPYAWSAMTDGPTVNDSSAREAIAALTHDTGVSVNMSYSSDESGAGMRGLPKAFMETFGYSNALEGMQKYSAAESAVKSNLDAELPVLYSINFSSSDDDSGHAVIFDGYGYDNSTRYYHINMGWSGSFDAWYNVPVYDPAISITLNSFIYNLYTSGEGEIISGRVTDSAGKPIAGVSIAAVRSGGGSYNVVTNDRGIYFFKKVPSDSTYQITAQKTGYLFPSQSVSTGRSIGTTTNLYPAVGNVWGADFTSSTSRAMPWLMLLLSPSTADFFTVTSETGRVWMDRNLGASRVATSISDGQAYGDLYQWGRLTDGHQKRKSSITAGLSTSDIPGHGYFITASSNWRNPKNNQLWQGAEGTNNPCPVGFRVPTSAEWQEEINSWSSQNAAGAFASPLKLSLGGFRFYSDGVFYVEGSGGYYWSSMIDGDSAFNLTVGVTNANLYSNKRATGFSIRCIADEVPTVTSNTGRIWMDRNLGASRVATSQTDSEAYGDLYQWGRLADGHEERTSGITLTRSSSDTPPHENFIVTSLDDWRNPKNDALWQGINGLNNPCPTGFRLPTKDEFQEEVNSWVSQDAAGAFASPLKFCFGGFRFQNDGEFYVTDVGGYYWTSTVDDDKAFHLTISDTNANLYSNKRAGGFSARCIKN